ADASLVENTPIPADEFVIDHFAVTIGEFGRSVPFTSFAKDLAHFDLENSIQDVLMTQMRKVLDTSAAVAFKSTPLKAVPTGAATLTFESPLASVAVSNLTVAHIGLLYDKMYATQLAPFVDGDNYVLIVNNK